MLLNELSVGTTIYVDIQRKGELFSLPSKVQNTYKHGALILPPSIENEVIKFDKNDTVYIRIKTKAGYLRWACEEKFFVKEKGISLLKVKSIKKGSPFNRREAYRLPLNIEETGTILGKSTFDMIIKDISETGVGFTTFDILSLNDVISFSLCSDQEVIPIVVRIVRYLRPENEDIPHEYGGIIIGKAPNLPSFILKKQREELRKIRTR